MSYNGSGTFVINTAGQPVVSGTVISSTAFNALTADLATGLSTAITKDGQTTPTANIPMGNNKITGLAVGTAATDAANLSQVQSTAAKLVGSVSGVDTITGTMSPTLAAYAAGQMFYFVAAGDNTGAVTLNLDGLGAKAVTRDGSVALAAGDIKSGEVVVVVYDGTRFQVVSQLNSAGNATFANVSITSALNVGGVATFSGGTANGVTYLNASKALTSGSALTFDGTNFATTGTATATKLVPTGNVTAGNGMYLPTTNTLAWSTDGSERLRIDSSGNLGLGVTPGTWWASSKVFQIGAGAALWGQTDARYTYLTSNTRFDGSDYRYIATGAAAQYVQEAGVHSWYNQASGTGGNTFTQGSAKMTLDASGNLGVGTTSPTTRFEVAGSGTAASSMIVTGSSTTNNVAKYGFYTTKHYTNATSPFGLVCGETSSSSNIIRVGGGYGEVTAATSIEFYTAANNTTTTGTERARITSGGQFVIGGTSGDGNKLSVQETTNANDVVFFENSNASFTNRVLSVNATRNTTNGTWKYLVCSISNVAAKFEILDSGTANNATGTYGTISDQRLKQDIVDAPSQWDDIKAVRFRKYRMKTDVEADPNAPAMLGVVAQELEQVCPGLVDEYADKDKEGNDLGTTTKTVKSSILLMKAAVALQEAMARIESLEAKVAALEAK